MFATGIENSYPTIDGGRVRQDQMESCGHYEKWKLDFDLVQEMGIEFLRYGPPIHRTWLGDGRYDWEFSDLAFGDLQRRNINPIVDLCHFGVPDFIGDFQNPDFPRLFVAYARAFAERYPWIQLYTPVNEMYICALFSARYGWWNEQLSSDYGFVTAVKHIVRANVDAMRTILDVRPDALFIQSESTEYFHAERPEAIGCAEFRNAERFLTLDLNYGYRVPSGIYQYLMDNGMTREEYDYFMNTRMKQHSIMGNDYYITNEHLVDQTGHSKFAGEVFGYDEITRHYYERYRLPVMHTETNMLEGPNGDEAANWLWKQWANVLRVRNNGVPVVGFTWYSLTDQTDWDVALRERRDKLHPVGLYDLDRNERAAGRAYRALIKQWQTVLPVQSVCLQVPVVTPQEYDEPFAHRRRDLMRRVRSRLSGPQALEPQR
jgi:beta-glucosidase/6-phospho-beta-glucosidase/beta-galactosidase